MRLFLAAASLLTVTACGDDSSNAHAMEGHDAQPMGEQHAGDADHSVGEHGHSKVAAAEGAAEHGAMGGGDHGAMGGGDHGAMGGGDHGAMSGGDHGAMGGHMGHMDDVKTALKSKLGAAYDKPIEHLDHADLAKGKATFDSLCVACHGAQGKGDGPAAVALNPKPANFTDAAHARYYSDAGRLEIITNGIPVSGSAMVGFSGQLSEAQILDVYAFVASLRGDAPPAEDGHTDHAH